MRLRLDPRRSAVEASSARLPARLLAVVFVALALAGCDVLVPMPDIAMLKPQAPPKCESRQAPTGTEGGDTAKIKELDYEVQCYRHAEIIARNRLGRLQHSIREAARAQEAAAKRSETAGNP